MCSELLGFYHSMPDAARIPPLKTHWNQAGARGDSGQHATSRRGGTSGERCRGGFKAVGVLGCFGAVGLRIENCVVDNASLVVFLRARTELRIVCDGPAATTTTTAAGTTAATATTTATATYIPAHSLTQAQTRSLAHRLSQSVTQSLTHPPTHPPRHSLTHSLALTWRTSAATTAAPATNATTSPSCSCEYATSLRSQALDALNPIIYPKISNSRTTKTEEDDGLVSCDFYIPTSANKPYTRTPRNP